METFLFEPTHKLTNEEATSLIRNVPGIDFKIMVYKLYDFELKVNIRNFNLTTQQHRNSVPTDLVLAKEYFNQPSKELEHLVNLGVLISKNKLELVQHYFPKQAQPYKYRISYRTTFITKILESSESDYDAVVQEYSDILRNDIFLIELCNTYKLNLDQKIREIIIQILCWVRHKMVKTYSYTSIIKALNKYIVTYYTFVHSSISEHIRISEIVSIVSGKIDDYLQHQLYILKHRGDETPVIQDIINIYLQKYQLEELWEIVQMNLDLVMKISKTPLGCRLLGRWFYLLRKLSIMPKKKDNRYQCLFLIKKRCVNDMVNVFNRDNILFNAKLFEDNMKTECICCFEEFVHSHSICVECKICKCTYHIDCLSKMFTKNITKCAHCRTESYGQYTNLPHEIGILN